MQNIAATLTIDGEIAGDAKSIALDMLDMGYDHVCVEAGGDLIYTLQVADIEGAGEYTHTFRVAFTLGCDGKGAAPEIIEQLLQHGYDNARACDGEELNASVSWEYPDQLTH